MAKRKKEKKSMTPLASKIIDFFLSILSGLIAAAIWYAVERLFTG